MGPLVHYARYGRAEGRATDFDPDPYLRAGGRPFDPEKPTVLLACHEATRTGAPILGWNLARELNRDHNLILVVQEPRGDLLDLFAAEASVLVGPFAKTCLTWFWMARFGRHLASRYAIEYAIANSIETQWVLIGLAAAGIPTVTLVHEYPTSPESEGRMQSGMALSQQVVFDAVSQHEAALACWPGITGRNTHVFHQAASAIPPDPGAPARAPRPSDPEGSAVYRAVRGDGTKPVVLGLGTVSMRKGPDLFIGCAVAAARRLGPGRARFVWIGHVPKPHPEGHFMEWLADQAKRSGLGDDLEFLDAVAEIEERLRGRRCRHDLLAARSVPERRDGRGAGREAGRGLPWGQRFRRLARRGSRDRQARRALSRRGCGRRGAGRRCSRIRAGRHSLGAALKARGTREFGMVRYRERLAPLVASAKAIAAQERRDIDLLLGDDTFTADLWLDPNRRLSREEAIRLHVREAAAGHEANQYCRRPALGFVPQDYADHHPDIVAEPYPNPLAHWIRAGKPAGTWTHPVLVAGADLISAPATGDLPFPGEKVPDRTDEGSADGTVTPRPALRAPSLSEGRRAALHLHLHYPELADGFLAVLGANAARLDLFVSTTSDEKAEELKMRFAGYERGTVRIEACPNRGRDLGPMLSRFAEELQGYDVFGHLHGKRSLALTSVGLSTDLGVRWHEFLTQHLLGDQVPMADLILERFAADPNLGLVFPEDPNLTGWSLDRELARDLAKRMASDMTIPLSIDFPIGTMFWARPLALKPLFDLHLGFDDYPAEPVPIDGTMLHALERLLPVIVRHAGFGVMTTHVPGVTR